MKTTKFVKNKAKLFFLTAILGSFSLSGIVCADMVAMSDADLSNSAGQALFDLSQTNDAGQNINFYKMKFNVKADLNLNVSKLSLGCNSVNGSGCDIDIDNLSLSGGGGPLTDMIITRPFIEFAIANDNNPATREIRGFRISADSMKGILQAGNNTSSPNGINVFSGYMNASGFGSANTNPVSTSGSQLGLPLSGQTRINVTGVPLLGSLNNLPGSFSANGPGNYTMNVGSGSASFSFNNQVVSGTRITSAPLSVNGADVSTMSFTGQISGGNATTCNIPILGCLNSAVNSPMSGSISGLKANITFSERLGYIHRVDINNPFSLSLQKQSVYWPGAPVTAQRGWWMALNGTVNLGQVNPANGVDLPLSVVQQVIGPVNNYLNANPLTMDVSFGDALSGQITQAINVGNIPLNGTTVSMSLADLPLGASQNIVPNCYGNRTFC